MGEPPLFGDVAGGGTGNGRPRKARRDPSGLASSASSPKRGAQRVEKPPSAREVPRRGGGREPCHSPKYFGQPYSSLPHRLRAEPPRRGGLRGEHTFFDSLSSPKRGAFLRGRSPRGKPPHQGRWPRSRPEGFGKLAGGCPLMRGHGQLRAAYMPPLQSSDLKQRPSREQQPLKTAGVRGNTRI